MTLPTWASHLEHKLAPSPLLLVQAFVNTLDLDLGTDMLAQPEEAQAWLTDAGLTDAASSAEPAGPDLASGLRLVREARAGIQALIARNTDGGPLTEDDLRPLEKAGREARPRLHVGSDGRVRLVAAAPASGAAMPR